MCSSDLMSWVLFSLVSKYNDCKYLRVEFHPKDLVGNKSKFESMFTPYGKCTFEIETDENCKPTGIGFVSYGTSEEAKEATNLNGVYLGKHSIRSCLLLLFFFCNYYITNIP